MPDVITLVADEPDPGPQIIFCGQTFTLPDTENTMAFMEYAAVATEGVDSGSLQGLAALHNLLEGCLGRQDWPRFKALAKSNRSSGDDLFEVVRAVVGAYADRPTTRPSDSSDGPSSTAGSSEVDIFSRARAKLEAKNRPDLARFVDIAEEHSRTA